MPSNLDLFEKIARRSHLISERGGSSEPPLHPFDLRNIHPSLPPKVRKLFDDGHYSESTFEAFKFIDKIVQKVSKQRNNGVKLMMNAFNGDKPPVKLNTLSSESEIDEQKGFSFLFSGGVLAIRNPRGHEVNMNDDPDTCLDHLAFASLLIRRLEQAKLI